MDTEMTIAEMGAASAERRRKFWAEFHANEEASRPTVSDYNFNPPKAPDTDYSGLINALEVEAYAGYVAFNIGK